MDKESLMRNQADSTLSSWREKEKTALDLLQIVGELRFDRAVELVLFKKDIYDSRPSELLNKHTFAKNYIGRSIPIEVSLSMAHAIANIDNIPPAKIDIGKLALEWHNESSEYVDIDYFIKDKLVDIIGKNGISEEHKDVVLYGFGRIGRSVARRIISLTGRGEQLRLKAIVVRPKTENRLAEVEKRAALLADDSIHGEFHGTVDLSPDGSQLIINGNRIQVIFADHPREIDYSSYGIRDAILIDNTGVWRNREGLVQHFQPGISQVLLTAPGSDIPNVVYGVNEKGLNVDENPVFCTASCTTNAIVPILKVIDDEYGIAKGHIETIHAYTSDQNLLDNFHKKPRRGRGAAINMVLTTTNAPNAASKILPRLKGKLTGNSVRVPISNVSLAIISLTIHKITSPEEVNELLKNASLHGDLVEQIYYSNSTEYVSSHAIGMTSTSVLDAPSTIVSSDGKSVILYAWYDNEFGYGCQVVRLAKYASKVRRYRYY